MGLCWVLEARHSVPYKIPFIWDSRKYKVVCDDCLERKRRAGEDRENGRGAWGDFWGDGCFGCGIVSCSYVYVSKQLRPYSLNMCNLLYASYISVSKHNLHMPRVCSGYCLGSERQQGFVCCLFYSLREEHLGLELLSWSSQGFVCCDMHIEPSGQGLGFIWSVLWLLWKSSELS